MPPFGNLYGVPVVVDRSLAEDDTIVVQAGTRTDMLSLKYEMSRGWANPGLRTSRATDLL